jgi:hypothetical protein
MTRVRLAALLLLMTSGIPLAGCDDAHPTAATTVSLPPAVTPQPTLPAKTIVVRGYVYDPAYRPVGGATIAVLDGPHAGTTASSNSRGEFTLSGAYDDLTRFRAARDGYLDGEGSLLPACATCESNRILLLYLNVPDPPVLDGGDFMVTFTTDSRCGMEMPDDMRTRQYSAVVAAADGHGRPAGTHFEVRILDATVQDGLGYGYFAINVAGSYVSVELGDFHGQPGLVEQVDRTRYLAFGGGAASNVASGDTIDLPFDGFVDYCAVDTALTPGRYECPAIHVAHVRCESANHRVTLTRR